MNTAPSLTEDLKALEALISPFRAAVLEYSLDHNYIQLGQDISDLPPNTIVAMVKRPDYLKRCCERHLREKESERLQAERMAEIRKRQYERDHQQRLDRLRLVIPAEYRNISEAASPRPRQFRFLSTFFSAQESPFQNEKFSDAKHGLILSGPTGLGKTADEWAMVFDSVKNEIFDDYLFIKSTEFFRKAKLKHLDSKSKTEFDELFQPMLDTELLVLDDIGSEKISEGACETMFELIDHRTERWAFTVLSSNLSVEALALQFGRNAEKTLRRLQQFFQEVEFSKP